MQKKSILNISQLGSPEQLRALAKQGYGPTIEPKVNSHVHLPPNFSAFGSVQQALTLAKQQGVGVLGASNYYDFSVYEEFAILAKELAIFPLYGLEIIAMLDELAGRGERVNDPSNPGKMYICGKGITGFADQTGRAAELIKIIRENDERRMAAMIEKLAAVFRSHGLDTDLNEEAVIDIVVGRGGCDRQTVTLQERHIGLAFQEALFDKIEAPCRGAFLSELFGADSKIDPDDAVAIQGEIRSRLMKAGKPAFVEEAFLDFPRAYELILELGGIPCYPVLVDGSDPLCEYETPVEKLIEAFKDNNIHMAEFIPARNQPGVLSEYVRAMREAGIAVVAGTEHNTLELLPIEPSCVGEVAVPGEIKEIFVEGAYIVAAHQFLCARGEQGYVDQQGNLNLEYETAEQRMSAFAKLGGAVVQKYFDSN